VTEETIDISKLSEEGKEAFERIYNEIWDLYAKAGCPYGRSYKGLRAWVEDLMARAKEGEWKR
jgi:hypothetical protein